MTNILGTWRRLAVAAVVFTALFLISPKAHADIVEVEAATGCPGSVGGGLCDASNNPFDLSFFGGGIKVADGRAVLPDAPGLGVDADWEALERLRARPGGA